MPPLRASLLLALLLTAPAGAQHPAAPAPAALEPASTGGLPVVDRALAKLSGHRRVLVVGAHPDDEDTGLLTYVARALGGEAAYLSLSRGEGGQNLVGPELGVGLGLLRSGELEAARSLEGTRQFFTRAFDFGYTRSLEETFARWPRERLLEDGARVVRRFRPQVIVAIFPADERAGHGQHQASGVVARELFDTSGDPDRYPDLTAEGLPPWRAEAFLRAAWWRPEEATLELPLGVVDPLDGRSIQQLAAASRSLHRSQDMGRVQELGPRGDPLIRETGGEGGELFGGIDTRLSALAAALPQSSPRREIEGRLDRVAERAAGARERLSPVALDAAVPELAAILGDLRAARSLVDPAASPAGRIVDELLAEKIGVAEAGLAAAAGVAVDAWAEREAVTPGDRIAVELAVWNAGRRPLEVEAIRLLASDGWVADPSAPARESLAPGALASRRIEAGPAAGGAPTLPYYLKRPLAGDLYEWAGVAADILGESRQPPPLVARFELAVDGVPIALEREVVFREGDQALGEVRRPLRAVPALEVTVSPAQLVWPIGAGSRRELAVEVVSHLDRPVAGRLEITAPPGWPPIPVAGFTIDEPEGRRSLRVVLEAPPEMLPGAHDVAVEAVTAEGARFGRAYRVVEHPHVRPAALPIEARVGLRTFELDLPAVSRVGYIRGASDRVPEMLAEVGLPIEPLAAADLERLDLTRFDAIVVGSRAYESDPELGRLNPRLLDWVRRGGLLVVQYQQYQFAQGGFAPFPLEIARPHGRVTDEGAPVRRLDPEHPLFHRPNPIGPADWEGWVQERGLYFAGSWDDAYTPLLALADPGRPEERGALLVARLGEGTWVYTGLSFFRQLPAGVPGAFRLFANLLELRR